MPVLFESPPDDSGGRTGPSSLQKPYHMLKRMQLSRRYPGTRIGRGVQVAVAIGGDRSAAILCMIATNNCRIQFGADLHQQFVTEHLSAHLVDRIEVVQVDQRDRAGTFGGNGVAQRDAKLHAIGQAGQEIVLDLRASATRQ